jgi:hypothetical protein
MPRATDCALLVAVPTTEADFSADVQRGADFATRWLATTADGDVVRGWERFLPYARLCRQVLDEALRLGVTVIERASLTHLTEAIPTFAVVTLIAHSCGPEFDEGDIADSRAAAAALPDLLRTAARWMRSVPPPPATSDCGEVAAWLNDLLNDGLAESPATPRAREITRAATRIHAFTEQWMRRRAVEAAARGAFRPGVGVEFNDDFHSLEAIEAVLPERLDGTLDLTVCESVHLGELLRARRAGGVIMSNAEPTTLDFRLALYRQTLALMVRREIRYIDAALMLRRHLKRSLCRT